MIDRSIPLSGLLAGQGARITRLAGPAGDVHRLEELGFRPGTPLRMFRPGNPCIIHLAGNKVCLRAEGPLRILVQPDAVS